MADPQEPKRPARPLPRLWKGVPEEAADPSPPTKGKAAKPKASEPVEQKSKGAKAKPVDGADKPQGSRTILREETPELDTVETRQRMRALIGTGIVGVIAAAILLVYQAFRPAPSSEDDPIDFGVAAPAGPGPANRDRLEKEAGVLLENARQVAKNGNTPLAVTFLERLTKSYPGTAAATEAKVALARPGSNLPLFLDRPTVVASDGQPTTPVARTPAEVVIVSPASVSASEGAEADLRLPANLPEPTSAIPVRSDASRPAATHVLPKGFRADMESGTHTSGWPLAVVSERDGAPMVLVPGGTFVRGRDGAEPSEAPAHKVNLSTYYVDQHEVTVRQFKLFERETGKRADRVRALGRDPSFAAMDDDPDRPVVMVSANDASAYAAWAGKQLPTEAQWEAAARTSDGRPFPWGTDAEPRKDGREVRPVMTLPKDLSPYGAFDLGGNAWEWTRDWYDPRAYASFKFGKADNPTGPATRPRSGQLVVKGASTGWESSARQGVKFDARLPYLGFRCVLPVEGPGNAFEPPPSPGEHSPTAPPGGREVVPF